MGKKLKSYTDKFRADAVVLLESSGYPDVKGQLEKVAKHLGIHRATLLGWYRGKHNPPPDELVSESRVELKDAIRGEMDAILKAMGIVRPDATFRDLGVVFGIMTDKLQLISGEPTGNIKQAITFERTGISTLPEHLAPSAATSVEGSETV